MLTVYIKSYLQYFINLQFLQKQKDFIICQDRPMKGDNLNQQKSFLKQRDQGNGSYKDTNSHNRINGNEDNLNDIPIVKCDIDWIKEGEKIMDRKRKTGMEQNTNGENLSSQQNKQYINNNVAGINVFCNDIDILNESLYK